MPRYPKQDFNYNSTRARTSFAFTHPLSPRAFFSFPIYTKQISNPSNKVQEPLECDLAGAA